MTVEKDEHGRYLSFRERTTKTRQGASADTRDAPPKKYENPENPSRCPVTLYEKYAKCRPPKMQEFGTPFYLGVNNMIVDPSNELAWYKNAAIGKNTLGSTMKNMTNEAGLGGRFSNHTVRKTSLTNLLQAGVPPTVIQHISGHKNVGSISHYATASKAQVKCMNEILLNPSLHVPEHGQIQSDIPKRGSKTQDESHTVQKQSQSNDKNIENCEILIKKPRFENAAGVTQNQTAISGLLHNSTLNNCTFNFAYPMPDSSKIAKN